MQTEEKVENLIALIENLRASLKTIAKMKVQLGDPYITVVKMKRIADEALKK